LKNIYLLGCGKTTEALSEEFGIEHIYDDFKKSDRCRDSSELIDLIKSDDTLVPTPAVPPTNKLIQKFKDSIVSEYDLIYQEREFPFSIWISGTNGKTTTTEMITHLLSDRGAVSGGNIGTPLAKLPKDSPIWVLETSSFMLHYTVKAKPNLYVLLPITDDHIEWHGSFSEYEQSKLKVIERLQEGEIAIVPEKYIDVETDGYLIGYSDEKSLSDRFGIDISKVDFQGGFLLDALLALATTKVLFDEVDYEKINSFQRSAHRQEQFRDSKDRVWINDSKATNVESTLSLLRGIDKDREIFLIIGGVDKGADWTPLFRELAVMSSLKVFGIGRNRENMLRLSEEFSINFQYVETIKRAVDIIKQIHSDSSLAILSPASASFDQFNSYIDRGESFKRIVLEK